MTSIRAAITQTRNVFTPMPESVDELSALASRLEEIRLANVDHHVDLVGRAKAYGTDIICLGELFTAPYFALDRHAMWRDMAEDARTGPTITRLREVARTHDVAIVAPIYERDRENLFNTAVVIGEDGSVTGKYRKCHIPHGRNDEGEFVENFYYAPSDGNAGTTGAAPCHFPVFETRKATIGVAICYDRHFPGTISALATKGAQIVFVPAVTFGAQSRRLWELEFATDAIRHGIYVGGSNRVGAESPWNQEYFGDSHFVGPEGRLPDASDDQELIIADLDLDDLTRGRSSGWNFERDRRPEIYGD